MRYAQESSKWTIKIPENSIVENDVKRKKMAKKEKIKVFTHENGFDNIRKMASF